MSFWRSSIGKKYLVAIAGLVWTLFVAGHMAGNLLIFAGAEAFNKYGHAIVDNKPLLYTAEVILVLSILTHVVIGYTLTIQNRKAKKSRYAESPNSKKKPRFASQTMAIHGTIVLAFLIYHLITFKYGTVYTIEYDGVPMRDLHRLMVEVFNDPRYVIGYIISLILLGVHLSHGTSSIFQSVGINHPRFNPIFRKAGLVYALIVSVGFIAQPIYVFFFL